MTPFATPEKLPPTVTATWAPWPWQSSEPRRPGDPPRLVASPDRIADELGWKAQHGLADIARTAWEAWQAGPRRIG